MTKKSPQHLKRKNGLNRLILVTNREPIHWIDREGIFQLEKTPGGLVAALEPAMEQNQGIWVSGNCEKISDNLVNKQTPYKWVPVNYDEQLHEGFYLGFSNRVLWPLFHSMMTNRVHFQRSEWNDYNRVNLAFAKAVGKICKPNDFVWVHDYQLTLVPKLLRKEDIPKDLRIGFFLHIPFPSYDLFRTLPWGVEILKGMLGANLIGFHINDYCQHFFDCVESMLQLRCDRTQGTVRFENRTVHVKAIPISIDTKSVQRQVDNETTIEAVHRLRSQMNTKYLIMGVDRLDYTKGIYKRLRALEVFFERYPKRRKQVSMIQLAVPTRTEIAQYQELREEIESLVGHINGLYARPGWTPLTYMCRSLPFNELLALYCAADIGLVTPFRDGMNLVAKEYVAAHHKRPGVLILSELAGAAEELTEALMVNPYDVDGIAEAIEKALQMPLTERKKRMRSLNTKILQHDVHEWVQKFINEALYAD